MASDWNLLMERLARAGLSQREVQIVTAIARRTLGWRKSADRISVSQLAEATQLDRRDVSKTLDRLERRGVVYRSGGSRGRGRTATIGLDLAGTWTEKSGGTADFQERKKAAVPPQEKSAVPPHTRGKGVKTSQVPGGKTLQQRAFDVYLGAGGSITLDNERGTLARSVTASAKRGVNEELILAACRDLGRKGEFPGYLKQRIAELEERGGPCTWDGLDRSRLTRQQLLECGCSRCGEWAEAGEEGAPSSRPAPPGLSLHELVRSTRRSEDGARELVDELVAAGFAVESSPGRYELSAEAEEDYGEGLRSLGEDL